MTFRLEVFLAMLVNSTKGLNHRAPQIILVTKFMLGERSLRNVVKFFDGGRGIEEIRRHYFATAIFHHTFQHLTVTD